MKTVLKNERGIVTALMLLTLPLLLFMMGFLLDAGAMVIKRMELQQVADAAALTGASFRYPFWTGEKWIYRIDHATAQQEIRDFLNRQRPSIEYIDFIEPANDDTITVRVREKYNTYFMKVFGYYTKTIEIDASAGFKQL